MLFKSGTLFTSAFWFIRALFIVEIAFAVLTYVLSRIEWKKNFSDTIMAVISILSLLFGYFLSLEHIQLLDFSNCFVGFTLFWLGTMMKKTKYNFYYREKAIYCTCVYCAVIS